MFARKAIGRGASAWTGTFYGNLWLGLIWLAVGIYRWDVIPPTEWWKAVAIGLLFFSGQCFTYMAFRHGDVSVATPVFGVKILMVAGLTSLLTGQSITTAVWIAAIVATLGIVLVQSGGGPTHHTEKKKILLTVLLALAAASCMSLFDVCLQRWGVPAGALRFLPAMFVSAALFSCVLLPWVDTPRRLTAVRAIQPMLFATILMPLQSMGMTIALSQFGDATRVNIVYSLRGLWAIAFAWLLARFFEGGEQFASRSVMICRAAGAVLLTIAVITSLLS
ncbi:MAG: EamA family transporter [Planctomycetaceae bacterium]|nr:EamA family transporter [Planctomycetaceae bacterium]